MSPLVYSKYMFSECLFREDQCFCCLCFLATPPPDIQHLRALAMFLCIVCTRPPPDPILDIGHRLIGNIEHMLIGRNMYDTFVAHPHAFFLITSQTSDSFTRM